MVDNIRIHYLVIDRQGYAVALNAIGYTIVMMLGGGVICLISITFGSITGFIGLSTLLLCVSGIRFFFYIKRKRTLTGSIFPKL